MALANTLSGMVESTSGCISEHALEHILSGVYKNLPHGAGLIMLSVAYFSKIAEKHTSDDRLVELAKAFGNKRQNAGRFHCCFAEIAASLRCGQTEDERLRN